MKSVTDIIGTGVINPWPELPRKKIDEFIELQITINDFKIVKDFNSPSGPSTFVIINASIDNESFSSLVGGKVIVRKFNDLKLRNVKGDFTAVFSKVYPEGSNWYYDVK